MTPFPNRKATRPGTTRRARMKGFDYSTPGYYFVTICCHRQNRYFGKIHRRQIHLTPAGEMIQSLLSTLESQYQTVTVDSFVVMPNHIHALIGLAVRLDDEPHAENLQDVLHWFKTTSHRRFTAGVRSKGWTPYQGRVWQEGFNDHIIRNDKELEILREYIATNVERWEKDTFFSSTDDVVDPE